MDVRPLIGLFGALLAALTVEFNDGVVSAALTDVRGGLGISHDPGTWLLSLYATGQVIGMALATWWAVTVSIRRFSLFAIALCCVTSLGIPLTSNLTLLYGLRLFQGMSAGFNIPLLLTIGLRVLKPPIRLYGLAAYALTATFGPNVATGLAALWTDVVGWQFVFLETLPLCALAGVSVWYGVEQDPPRYERLPKFDWLGALLVVVGLGSFTTMLEQGDRFDWFNSPTICVLALVSAVCIPLLVANDLRQEQPLFRFSLLKRRNLLYALIALFTFLLINLSASTIPGTFLTEVAGFRPIQAYGVTMVIAASQLVLLPLMAVLLDHESVDARVVSFIGMACILAACIGNVFLTSVWQGGGFLIWQGLQSVGDAMIIMPLLMMATNTVRTPEEGPYASTLVNTMRGIAEPVGVWLLQLIMRWRGALHFNRIVDQSGQGPFSALQHPPRAAMEAFQAVVEQQATVLTLADAFLIIAGLVVVLMAVLLVVPERTQPPRIALAKH